MIIKTNLFISDQSKNLALQMTSLYHINENQREENKNKKAVLVNRPSMKKSCITGYNHQNFHSNTGKCTRTPKMSNKKGQLFNSVMVKVENITIQFISENIGREYLSHVSLPLLPFLQRRQYPLPALT